MSDVQQLLAKFAGEHIGDQGRGVILSLLQITQGLSPHMGEDYFRALTRELATVLESSIVYVGEFNRTARTVRSIACWENGRFREELEYHVDAAPCADVVAGRRTVHLEGAARRFPGHGLLQQYEIEAYVGVPIRDGGGGVQGLIVLLWPEPVEKIDDLLSTVELCTPRAGAELERHREEQARHKAQELIRQSQRAAEQARDAAEQTSRAKDQFLAALSHELRTPLTPVLLAATHLQSLQTLPTQVRESVEVIYHGVALEARLIDDLLDIARISNGKLELQPAPVNIHDVIGSARQICSADLRDKNLRLIEELDAQYPLTMADDARMQQVLWNLLKNAVKFTPPGGTITIRSYNAGTPHELQCPYPPELIVEVNDTGVGMTPEVLGGLFTAFEQGGRQITRQYGGLGLGLSISKAIVELHGGAILAHSHGPGKGSTFTIRLATCDAPQGLVSSGQQPNTKAYGRLSTHVLLVEDHHSSGMMLKRVLESAGHEVSWARSCQEAFQLILGRSDFGLLVSDLGLPDGDGLSLMPLFRERIGRPGIALSGYGMDQDVKRTGAAGFALHLVKPIDTQRLLDSITSLCREFPSEIQAD